MEELQNKIVNMIYQIKNETMLLFIQEIVADCYKDIVDMPSQQRQP